MTQLLTSIGLMEDTNKGGSNDTSINHLGREAGASQNNIGIYVPHYYDNDQFSTKYGLNSPVGS